LLSAYGLAAGPQERALVEFNLYIVWALLGRDNDARHWLVCSLTSVKQAVNELAWALEQYVRDDRPCRRGSGWLNGNFRERFKGTIVVTVVAVVGGIATVGLAGPFIEDRLTASIAKRIGVLGDYVKFHNMVQYAMSRHVEQHVQEYLLLTNTGNETLPASNPESDAWSVLSLAPLSLAP
jgi:hypothetical protein